MSHTGIESETIVNFVTKLLNPMMHYKRSLSIGHAVVGRCTLSG